MFCVLVCMICVYVEFFEFQLKNSRVTSPPLLTYFIPYHLIVRIYVVVTYYILTYCTGHYSKSTVRNKKYIYCSFYLLGIFCFCFSKNPTSSKEFSCQQMYVLHWCTLYVLSTCIVFPHLKLF